MKLTLGLKLNAEDIRDIYRLNQSAVNLIGLDDRCAGFFSLRL